MIYETFREAIQNIWSNKFRTFLTMLGIIIGVTAVIVIVGLGNGMPQSIASSFSDLGTNIISVQVMGYGSRSVRWRMFTASWMPTRICLMKRHPQPASTAP